VSQVAGYKQARHLEDRNARIYQAWLFGSTQKDLAEQFNLQYETVRSICRKVEATAPERTRAVLNDRLTEAALMLLGSSRDLFDKAAPPIVTTKGDIVYDPETHEVARDYSAKIKAGQFMLQVIDRLSKLAGADMPIQVQVEHSANQAAVEQAEQVTRQFGSLTLVS
jgi:hypothetical protein